MNRAVKLTKRQQAILQNVFLGTDLNGYWLDAASDRDFYVRLETRGLIERVDAKTFGNTTRFVSWAITSSGLDELMRYVDGELGDRVLLAYFTPDFGKDRRVS